MENMNYDQNFKCTVTVNLENYTYSNKQQGYDTKKDATRKTYLLFGWAMAILDPNTGIFGLKCTHIHIPIHLNSVSNASFFTSNLR